MDDAGNNAPVKDHKQLIEALTHSPLYQEYERSFSEATGMPVTLRSVESWQLPYHGHRKENEFCALVAQKSRACANCLQVQQRLSDRSRFEPQTVTCAFGLSESAVPVRMGDEVIGFLQIGQVFRKRPSAAQFERVFQLAQRWGLSDSREELRRMYMGTRVVPGRQHDHLVRLLNIFAQHLSLISNQIFVQQKSAEPPVIARAKEYIAAHQAEDLSLAQVAKAVNTSTFYFCKIFRRMTGLNFTDYVSRVRVEKAKNLLLNRNLRVSEIAYEVGFQSLTHFNRVFKRILGVSPTKYRTRLPST
jgi:AraC-like DNA-binding protein/ligand-binding sensor protein